MPPEELTNVFGVVDALIVPSLCYENSPTVIYEALMSGIPVLASDIGGVGELIREGETGMLFVPGDAKDMQRVMHEMDKKKEWFSTRREEIRATMEPYALETYARKLVDILREVTQK